MFSCIRTEAHHNSTHRLNAGVIVVAQEMDAIKPLACIPTEVLLYILSFLNSQSLTRFGSTSRAHYHLLKEDPYLQSLMQLELCGAEACLGPPSFGPRERLSYMMSWESSWLQALYNPSDLMYNMVLGPYLQFCDIHDGVFVYGVSNPPQDDGDTSANDELCRFVRTLRLRDPAGDDSRREFVINNHSNESIFQARLSLQEHDLIAIFTIPPLTYVFPSEIFQNTLNLHYPHSHCSLEYYLSFLVIARCSVDHRPHIP